MAELIAALIVLAIITSMVAIVGHLLWLAGAAIIRAMVGSSSNHQPGSGASDRGDEVGPRVEDDLLAARRLLQLARFRRWISESEATRVDRLIERLDDRVQGRSTPAIADAPPRVPTAATPQRTPPTGPSPHGPAPTRRPPRSVAGQPAAAQPLADPSAEVPSPDPAVEPGGTAAAVPPAAAARPSGVAAVHPLDQPDEPAPAALAVPLRQRVAANLVQTFMQQANIRWIELVSASLIVICSLGLVISLWNTLAGTSRFFPSLVFLLATVAVHGAGHYTLRRWRLRSTSRGILQIGLMLIPLAVFVGILVSGHDGGQRRLDAPVLAVIFLGTCIYGGLAVAASRSLFARRWPLVAAMTIVASLSVLPVYFAAPTVWLHGHRAVLWMLPLVAVSAWLTLALSHWSVMLTRRHGLRLPTGPVCRMVGIVAQALFASTVVIGFWLFQAGDDGPGRWWWATVGLLGAVWASWGWAASFAPSWHHGGDRGAMVGSDRGHRGTWLLVLGFCIAAAAAMLILAGMWQAAMSRMMLTGLLLSSALWWLFHGWYCRLPASVFAAGCALWTGLAMLGEPALGAAGSPLASLDWLSFPRVAALTSVGLVAVVLSHFGGLARQRGKGVDASARGATGDAAAALPGSPVALRRERQGPATQQPRADALPELLAALRSSALVVLLATALLTVLACLVPWGETPYGGNWAPSLLLVYGALLILAGLASASRRGGAASAAASDLAEMSPLERLLRGLVPAGQLVMMLGSWRLFQSSPWLDGWVGDLRPGRSWAPGAMILACLWTATAAWHRWLDPRSGSLRHGWHLGWLCGLAVPLAAGGGLAIWTLGDQFHLASRLGWLLPLASLLLLLAVRQLDAREATLVVLSLWVGTLVDNLAGQAAWWDQLAWSARCGIVVIVLTGLLVLVERLQAALAARWLPSDCSGDQFGASPAAEVARGAATGTGRQSERLDWTNPAPAWASLVMVAVGWTATILVLVGPAIVAALQSFGVAVSPPLSPWLRPWTDNRDLLLVLLSTAALAGSCGWLANRTSGVLAQGFVGTISLVPLVTVMIAAIWVAPPYSAAAALWTTAAWLALGDWLSLANTRWRGLSDASWRAISGDHARSSEGSLPLTMARFVLLAVLLVGTMMAAGRAAGMALPEVLSGGSASWWVNAAALSVSLGPWLVVAVSRWLVSLLGGEPSRMLLVATLAAAAGVALLTGLSEPGGPSLLGSVIGSLHGWAWATVVLAAVSLLQVVLRHALLLGSGGWSQALVAGMRGARWRNVESAAWRLSLAALIAAALLSLLAAVAVVIRPSVLVVELWRLGGWGVVVLLVASIALAWSLAVHRDFTRFGLLAASLGLAAPPLAAGYGHSLASAGRLVGPAGNFQPLRLLVLLWLLSLAAGLVVRVVARRRGRSLRQSAEASWVVLALVVGGLGLFSAVGDPSPVWPSTQLSVLALLATLSGVVSGQSWRGHLAALVAAAGIAAWFAQFSALDPLQQGWNLFWGPLWVGVVAWAAGHWWLPLIVPASERVCGSGGVDGRLPISVDRTVSIGLPLVSSLLSIVALAAHGQWLLGAAPWVNGSIWLLVLAGLALAVARLWTPVPSQRGLGIYFSVIALGLVSATLFSVSAELPRSHAWLLWLVGGLGAMAAMAGALRELVREASVLGPRLGLQRIAAAERFRRAAEWMPAVHSIAALSALVPSVILVLVFEQQPLRVAATALPFLGALAILPLGSLGDRAVYRYCGLSLISASLVLLWWADLPSAWLVAWPIEAWPFAQRAMVALVLLGVLYPFLARRWQLSGAASAERWQGPLVHLGWVVLASGAAAGVALIVGQGLSDWRLKAAEASLGARLLTLLAWAGVAARLLQFAVRPFGSDAAATIPHRKAAVWAAEGAIVLLAAACYFHFPELFSGLLAPWWPLIVFGIAMASAGLGQWLRRVDQSIVGDPLHQSGLVLPLIPLLAAGWYRPESLAWSWSDWDRYALLLLTAAGLYGLAGWMQHSRPLRSFAALLAVLGFWSFLHSQPGLRFFAHPQFWLLPPALAVLVYVELQRQRLEAKVVVAARYSALLVAYLSSTAESLLLVFAGHLWQPLLLLVLALGGVAAGLLMQGREFLYCGLAFTFVALLAMVWHAQQTIGHVWPWWAFGIATGISLIVFLGYMETRKAPA